MSDNLQVTFVAPPLWAVIAAAVAVLAGIAVVTGLLMWAFTGKRHDD
jgi:uncharacterized membrane protein YphA (DoxX/SURF4 family)